jgi:hypothetical protein
MRAHDRRERRHVAGDAGRRFVVRQQYARDLPLTIGFETRVQHLRIERESDRSFERLDGAAVRLRDFGEALAERSYRTREQSIAG